MLEDGIPHTKPKNKDGYMTNKKTSIKIYLAKQ